MSAARAGDDDVGPARQEIDLELLVGRDGVEADLGEADRRIGEERDVASQELADDRTGTLRRRSGPRRRGRLRARRGGRP